MVIDRIRQEQHCKKICVQCQDVLETQPSGSCGTYTGNKRHIMKEIFGNMKNLTRYRITVHCLKKLKTRTYEVYLTEGKYHMDPVNCTAGFNTQCCDDLKPCEDINHCTSGHQIPAKKTTVKPDPPKDLKMNKSSGNLHLSWKKAAKEIEGSLNEIHIRRLNDSHWHNVTCETASGKETPVFRCDRAAPHCLTCSPRRLKMFGSSMVRLGDAAGSAACFSQFILALFLNERAHRCPWILNIQLCCVAIEQDCGQLTTHQR
ncbi:hypothetical protein EOD39_18521 [Acipenser ruthenus]|uniref:Uncharacterized protein n=1 Tax=Acipenser ruthenus TaxID=7906 RepID=A0A444V0S6_ACIRT|nr:hypothetical protein EOD39_18521 [Acipenser ruthenus]